MLTHQGRSPQGVLIFYLYSVVTLDFQHDFQHKASYLVSLHKGYIYIVVHMYPRAHVDTSGAFTTRSSYFLLI